VKVLKSWPFVWQVCLSVCGVLLVLMAMLVTLLTILSLIVLRILGIEVWLKVNIKLWIFVLLVPFTPDFLNFVSGWDWIDIV